MSMLLAGGAAPPATVTPFRTLMGVGLSILLMLLE